MTADPLVLVTAASGSLLATPIAIALGRRANWLDHPSRVKIHREPVVRVGGLGIVAGLLLAVTGRSPAWVPAALGLTAAAGFADDLWSLPARLKLGLLLAIGGLTGYAGMAPLGQTGAPGAVTMAVALACVANAVNLIDGLDGFAATVTATLCLSFVALFALQGNPVGMALALATLGAVLGYLPYNWHPARTFMGDVGSLNLGCSLALQFALLTTGSASPSGVLAGVMALGVPGWDVALTILRRWRLGRPMFEPDRSHSYNLVAERGLSHPQTALAFALVSALFGLLAVLAYAGPPWGTALALLLFLGLPICAAWRLRLLRVDPTLPT